jgi:hypothetical protein
MEFRWTLYDRLNHATVIDEPIGWDAFSLRIKRHAERHGTFRELQANQFEFTGTAGVILREEYETHGVRGRCELKIEGRCSQGWVLLYRGQVAFDEYSFSCNIGCSVTIGLDQVGALVSFINRFDQKVDISKGVSNDGSVSLADYSTMSRELLLPSKAIKLRGHSTNTDTQEYTISDDVDFQGSFPTGTGQAQGSICPCLANTEVNAIKTYSPSSVIDFYNWSLGQSTPELIFNDPNQPLNCAGGVFEIDLRVKGQFKNLVSGSGILALTLQLKRGFNDFVGVSATIIQSWSLSSVTSGTIPIFTTSFDKTYTGSVNLAPGEKLWLDFFFTYRKDTNFTPDVRILIEPETFFTAAVVSKCDPTTAKVFMLNETVSRVIESITNNGLKLYSDYYGRTDSEPYAMATDGCGGLRAITPGLNIRKAKMADDSEPTMFLSMKDIFESLSAIDNIGIGQEDTDNIRIEPWTYFYQDTVMFTCSNVEKLEKNIKQETHYSVFRNGYEKWEAEDYNGLDEFLTKREWRTDLSEVQNSLEKVSKWIASGYAWEVTRRKQNDTKDWRFDNDTFILCLSNRYAGSFAMFTDAINFPYQAGSFQVGDSITVLDSAGADTGTFTITAIDPGTGFLTIPGFVTFFPTSGTVINNSRSWVEVGAITNPQNILDPATVYNFRISPARNAMRWFNKISACYRNVTPADKLRFSSGDGNFLAAGLLPDTCQIEADTLCENEDINSETFLDSDAARAIAYEERIKFSYPLGLEEYRAIADSPYGLIAYSSSCESGEGWLEELEYSPETGQAKFTLITKIP